MGRKEMGQSCCQEPQAPGLLRYGPAPPAWLLPGQEFCAASVSPFFQLLILDSQPRATSKAVNLLCCSTWCSCFHCEASRPAGDLSFRAWLCPSQAAAVVLCPPRLLHPWCVGMDGQANIPVQGKGEFSQRWWRRPQIPLLSTTCGMKLREGSFAVSMPAPEAWASHGAPKEGAGVREEHPWGEGHPLFCVKRAP